MTTEKTLTPAEKAAEFRLRAEQLAKSFNNIKANPMNLNLLMVHVGALSLTIDDILQELANNLDKENGPTSTIN
jgi:hypothetical protein